MAQPFQEPLDRIESLRERTARLPEVLKSLEPFFNELFSSMAKEAILGRFEVPGKPIEPLSEATELISNGRRKTTDIPRFDTGRMFNSYGAKVSGTDVFLTNSTDYAINHQTGLKAKEKGRLVPAHIRRLKSGKAILVKQHLAKQHRLPARPIGWNRKHVDIASAKVAEQMRDV